MLDLCAELHEQGRTVLAVLHDLNQACRCATDVIVMRGGEIVAQGAPAQVMTAELVEHVFGVSCQVMSDPQTGTPMVVPGDRRHRRPTRLTAVAA